jgi:exopolyphosphatase / guanosine-5'-triphosphate,3'-diphosphate pyrophosphatase
LWRRHHGGVPVAVVDVGSNTVRLLVTGDGRELLSLRETLRLGESVERYGLIPEPKLAELFACVRRFADAARAHGASALEVLVTSPGRQASNGDEVADVLAIAAEAPVRILSSQEEGRLAFVGALAAASVTGRKRVAVVDVGGGSAQVVAGSRRDGPDWFGSVDLGSLRLTARLLTDDPPGAAAIARARVEVDRQFETFAPPTVDAAFAVGGSARALRRLYGSRLGAAELTEAVELLAFTPGSELSERFGVSRARATTLPAGAVLLEALQRRLEVPLKVSRTGLRHGALLELVGRELAAA